MYVLQCMQGNMFDQVLFEIKQRVFGRRKADVETAAYKTLSEQKNDSGQAGMTEVRIPG
jgi:hypothetical protein